MMRIHSGSKAFGDWGGAISKHSFAMAKPFLADHDAILETSRQFARIPPMGTVGVMLLAHHEPKQAA
jgi:hypothetical protein